MYTVPNTHVCVHAHTNTHDEFPEGSLGQAMSRGPLSRPVPLAGTPWRKEQTEDLQRVLGQVDTKIPLVLVSGNHDVGNSPTAETIAEFCRTWGDDYFSFWAGGVLFLVLNSQLWHDATQCPDLKEAQDRWLDQQLGLAREQQCRHAVVFQHIPLFLQSISEDDDYFNLGSAIRQELADKFTRAGRCQLVAWWEEDVSRTFCLHHLWDSGAGRKG